MHLPRETTSERPKMVGACSVFNMFTSKCASRPNGVHFFDISTSKSGPDLVCFVHFDFEMRFVNGVHFFDIATSTSAPKLRCFVHFDFEMCFAPQRRALFRHLNFQKWSEHVVLLCAFNMLTSKCASRHNGVQFFNLSSAQRASHPPL